MTQTIEQLSAKVAELEAENATWKVKAHESASQLVEFMHGAHSKLATERDDLRQQLAAAQEEIEEQKKEKWFQHQKIMGLQSKLATAEQRVSEACAAWCDNYGQKNPKYRHSQVERTVADDIAACIRSGEWKKFNGGVRWVITTPEACQTNYINGSCI